MSSTSDESKARMAELLKDGDTVWSVMRHSTKNGTSYIDFYKFGTEEDGRIYKLWLSYHMANAYGFTFDKRRECIRVEYLNMDQGFELVYRVSKKLGIKLRHEWL